MWNQAIVRELAVVLLFKLAALYVIWMAFFNQPDERELTHHEVSQLLLGEPSNGVTPHNQSETRTGERDGY